MSEVQMVMYLGFFLSAYAVVGNDVIQTLGTFLSSNENRPWWLLVLFIGGILTVCLFYGWVVNDGDVSYGRLIGDAGFANPKYKNPEDIEGFGWVYLLPPVILLLITRLGVPVSTSFLILTFFNEKGLNDMVFKSVSGYLVAFGVATVLYLFLTQFFERKWVGKPASDKETRVWIIRQWCSTAFLWSQWLIQDFANIYVYLPRSIDLTTLIFTVVIFWVFLTYIIYSNGGAIQSIIKAKTNTADIRSATIIDLSYALVLLFFKELSNIPMSTTWVFLGLLAGREIGIKYLSDKTIGRETLLDLGKDLGKVFLGLLISIALVYLVKALV